MYEKTGRADHPRPTMLTVEEIARGDAALDRRLSEPFWYPQHERWAHCGVISEDDWRRYRIAYAAARTVVPPAV